MHPEEDRRVFGEISTIEGWKDVDDLLPIFRRHDAVVSMRYHGLLLAALADRPAVAVAAHGKVSSLARALDCPVLRPEASREDVDVALRDAFDRHEDVVARVGVFREAARGGLQSLKEFLKTPEAF
jgi:polysaccharide pyruvyl transferase WcaK-like protein